MHARQAGHRGAQRRLCAPLSTGRRSLRFAARETESLLRVHAPHAPSRTNDERRGPIIGIGAPLPIYHHHVTHLPASHHMIVRLSDKTLAYPRSRSSRTTGPNTRVNAGCSFSSSSCRIHKGECLNSWLGNTHGGITRSHNHMMAELMARGGSVVTRIVITHHGRIL